MTNVDLERFGIAIGTLCEVFEQEMSELRTVAYYTALKKYGIDEVESAISGAITTCKFFPKPAELIALITGGERAVEDRAAIESSKVIYAIKSVGGYTSVMFDDPVTMAVVQNGFGGWIKLCSDMNGDDEKWFHKDFNRLYCSYHRQGVKFDGHLQGRAELNNLAVGYENCCNDVRMIGENFTSKNTKRITDENRIGNKITKLISNIGG